MNDSPEMRDEVADLRILPEELLRAAAIKWIDTNFSMLSGKPNATERLIACFISGGQMSWENALKAALDEIAAFAQSPEQQGEGMVLVPREPTEAMIAAHDEAHAAAETVFAHPAAVWSAMLASAPPIPDVQDGGEREGANHEDRIEQLAPPFYIRWTRGPDYERAYLCVDDGEPDMHDFATVTFGMARIFKTGLQVAIPARGGTLRETMAAAEPLGWASDAERDAWYAANRAPPAIPERGEVVIPEGVRPYPDLLTDSEQKAILSRAEDLWADLQANDLGGFSGINRPFYIVAEFKRVIEQFGHRDVGLSWSKDDLDAYAPQAGKGIDAGP